MLKRDQGSKDGGKQQDGNGREWELNRIHRYESEHDDSKMATMRGT